MERPWASLSVPQLICVIGVIIALLLLAGFKKKGEKENRHSGSGNTGQRIDHFLTSAPPDPCPAAAIEKLIAQGRVSLNGVVVLKKSREVFPGDRIVVEIEIAEETVLRPLADPAPSCSRTNGCWSSTSPPAWPSTPAPAKNRRPCSTSSAITIRKSPPWPTRSARASSTAWTRTPPGVLILAKSEEALERMQELFQEREMQKTYLALVKGRMRFRNGTIDLPLARSLKQPRPLRSRGRGPRGPARSGHRFFGDPRVRKIHLCAPDAANRPHPPAARPPGPFRQPGAGRHPLRQGSAARTSRAWPCTPTRSNSSTPSPATAFASLRPCPLTCGGT